MQVWFLFHGSVIVHRMPTSDLAYQSPCHTAPVFQEDSPLRWNLCLREVPLQEQTVSPHSSHGTQQSVTSSDFLAKRRRKDPVRRINQKQTSDDCPSETGCARLSQLSVQALSEGTGQGPGRLLCFESSSSLSRDPLTFTPVPQRAVPLTEPHNP